MYKDEPCACFLTIGLKKNNAALLHQVKRDNNSINPLKSRRAFLAGL
jgi:hypothetical protein